MSTRALAFSALLLGVAACSGARVRVAKPDNACPCPCVPAAPDATPASVEWDTNVSSSVDCNPVGTQHTFAVIVRDKCGHPLSGQRVEWILARHRDAVGDIVAVDDMYAEGPVGLVSRAPGNGSKRDNQYAVSVTNFAREILDVGNSFPVVDPLGVRMPDLRIDQGGSWVTITSLYEGVTDVIAYVPGIEDATRHMIFAKKVWADYEIEWPKDSESLLPDATHELKVRVRKASGTAGIAGVPVDAEVLDGPPAQFEGGTNRVTATTAADGNATFVLKNGGARGTNRLKLGVRGRFQGQDCPRELVVRKTWREVALACRCTLSAAQSDVGDPVIATVVVTNSGDATAQATTLATTLPPGLQPADGTTFPLALGPVPGGATVQRQFRLATVADGMQAVEWTASSPSGSATTTCACQVDLVRPKLEASCRCEPGVVDVGSPTQVVVSVANTGRGTLRNVVVTLTWPDGVKPQTSHVATLPAIAPGVPNPEQLIFQGVPQKPGPLHAVVKITADRVPEAVVTCEGRAVQCNLQATLVCPGHVEFGDPAPFVLKVKNVGDGEARGVLVRITHCPALDRGVDDLQAGTIAPGGEWVHEWTAVGKKNDKGTVTAEVAGMGCAARTECQIEVSGLAAIQSRMIDQDLEHHEKGIFVVGQEFLYVFEVSNDGGTDKTAPIHVEFRLPAELRFVSATSTRPGTSVTADGAQGAHTGTFALDVNEKATFEFRVMVVAVPPGNLVKAVADVRTADGTVLANEVESTTVK